jgi:hypothetical protein
MNNFYKIKTMHIFDIKNHKKVPIRFLYFFSFDNGLSKETSIFPYTVEQSRKQTHRQLWKNQPEIGNFHYNYQTIKQK